MYLEELFEKYAEWKILKFFLENPETNLHVKELSRTLDVSSGTASVALNKAANDGILEKNIIGKVHVYCLNKKNDQVTRLRRVIKSL